jgi:thioredoxin reductase (NADPH)
MAQTYDVAIIGRGPAGLSAAIYTGRAGFSTVVLGTQPKVWGEHKIDNYFGFPEGITGQLLLEAGTAQARRFGAEIRDELVLEIKWGEMFGLLSQSGEVEAPAVLIATGIARRKPKMAGLDQFDGRGVSYCVSCDGFFFKGKPVAVLGEGDHAAVKALELLNYTRQVTLCTDAKPPAFSEALGARLAQEGIALRQEKIAAVVGEAAVTGIDFEQGPQLPLEGVFVAVGEASSTDFARTLGIEVDRNFIVVNAKQQTNIPGIWAAGDCTGRYAQIATAVGDGAVAASGIIGFLRERKRARA